MAKNQTAAVQAPIVHTASKAKYVTVASKLPMSIEIQLCRPHLVKMTGQYGTAEETVHRKEGEIHVIRGTAYPSGSPPKGFPRQVGMIEDENGGYALTPKVPADFWAKWLEENAETDMVKSGMIKAQPDLNSLAADAKEHAHVDSGLGPLNPDGDRRNPKPMSSALQPIKPETRATAA